MITNIISKEYNKKQYATLYDKIKTINITKKIQKLIEIGIINLFEIIQITIGCMYNNNNNINILIPIWLIINGIKEIINKKVYYENYNLTPTKLGDCYETTNKGIYNLIWMILGMIFIS